MQGAWGVWLKIELMQGITVNWAVLGRGLYFQKDIALMPARACNDVSSGISLARQ